MSTLCNFTLVYTLEQFTWRPKLDGLPFDSIGDEEATLMERPFEESKVVEVVKNPRGDMVLVLNCFSLTFFQTCWEVLKEDIMNFTMSSLSEISLKEFSMQHSLPLFPRKWG